MAISDDFNPYIAAVIDLYNNSNNHITLANSLEETFYNFKSFVSYL